MIYLLNPLLLCWCLVWIDEDGNVSGLKYNFCFAWWKTFMLCTWFITWKLNITFLNQSLIIIVTYTPHKRLKACSSFHSNTLFFCKTMWLTRTEYSPHCETYLFKCLPSVFTIVCFIMHSLSMLCALSDS